MSDIPGNPKVSRKLAAILAADIAGYSALMAADEGATIRDLNISGKVHDEVRGKMVLACEYLGEKQLKNIVGLVRVYGVRLADPDLGDRPTDRALSLPEIAVLPFANLSGDPEEE